MATDNGKHYGKIKIEPIEFINANNLNFNVGNVVKYVTRQKSNRIEDLKKAIDYINFEIDRLCDTTSDE